MLVEKKIVQIDYVQLGMQYIKIMLYFQEKDK